MARHCESRLQKLGLLLAEAPAHLKGVSGTLRLQPRFLMQRRALLSHSR